MQSNRLDRASIGPGNPGTGLDRAGTSWVKLQAGAAFIHTQHCVLLFLNQWPRVYLPLGSHVDLYP